MAMAWQRLADAGLVECRVLAGADDVLKATRSAAGVQRLPNLEIFRVPGLLAPGQLDDAAAAWAAGFKPDVIFCALQVNLRHARRGGAGETERDPECSRRAGGGGAGGAAGPKGAAERSGGGATGGGGARVAPAAPRGGGRREGRGWGGGQGEEPPPARPCQF